MLKAYMQELKKIKLLELEEEKLLWQRLGQGDTDARTKLILSYQPLVFKTAVSFDLGSEQLLLEVIQEGMVGLIEVVERYDVSRGVAFSLFAIHRIRGRMLDYLQKVSSERANRLDFSVGDNDLIMEQLVDCKASPAEVLEESLLVEKVRQMLDCLPEKEQKVLQGIYIEQLSPDAMAKNISVSQTHVYRLQKQGVKRIRGMLSRFIHELKW